MKSNKFASYNNFSTEILTETNSDLRISFISKYDSSITFTLWVPKKRINLKNKMIDMNILKLYMDVN